MRKRTTKLLKELEAAIYASEHDAGLPAFKVDASATDIVELVLAFHAKGFFVVEGQPATQKWLIEWAEQAFGMPLNNWEQLGVNIRSRKSGELKFLGELMKNLNDRFKRILLGKQYGRRLKNKKV